jgi:hypothetical protein
VSNAVYGRLIDHYHVVDPMRAGYRFARAGLLIRRLALRSQKISIKNIVDQRRFAGTGNAGDTGEDAKRKIDIDIFQVVVGGASNLDERRRFPARFGYGNPLSAAQIIARERLVDRALRARC